MIRFPLIIVFFSKVLSSRPRAEEEEKEECFSTVRLIILFVRRVRATVKSVEKIIFTRRVDYCLWCRRRQTAFGRGAKDDRERRRPLRCLENGRPEPARFAADGGHRMVMRQKRAPLPRTKRLGPTGFSVDVFSAKRRPRRVCPQKPDKTSHLLGHRTGPNRFGNRWPWRYSAAVVERARETITRTRIPESRSISRFSRYRRGRHMPPQTLLSDTRFSGQILTCSAKYVTGQVVKAGVLTSSWRRHLFLWPSGPWQIEYSFTRAILRARQQ